MKRSSLNTTFDSEILSSFKSACKDNGEKMNAVLEVFMQSYVNGEFNIERTTQNQLVPKNK